MIQRFLEAPDHLEGLIQELVEALRPEGIGASAIIPFRKTVAAVTQDEQDRQVPFNGAVRDVVMVFPAGCQQLVEVRLIYYPARGSKVYIVPTVEDSFIALDNLAMHFEPRYPVSAPGQLRVEWYNYDSVNAHTVPVIVAVIPTTLEVKEE